MPKRDTLDPVWLVFDDLLHLLQRRPVLEHAEADGTVAQAQRGHIRAGGQVNRLGVERDSLLVFSTCRPRCPSSWPRPPARSPCSRS